MTDIIWLDPTRTGRYILLPGPIKNKRRASISKMRRYFSFSVMRTPNLRLSNDHKMWLTHSSAVAGLRSTERKCTVAFYILLIPCICWEKMGKSAWQQGLISHKKIWATYKHYTQSQNSRPYESALLLIQVFFPDVCKKNNDLPYKISPCKATTWWIAFCGMEVYG